LVTSADETSTRIAELEHELALARQELAQLRVSTRSAKEVTGVSEERYRFLVETSLDVIVVLDLTGRVLYANPAVTAMTGYSPEEFTSKPGFLFQVATPAHVPNLRALIENVVASGVTPTTPTYGEWNRKDGSILYTETMNMPLFDENGRLYAFQA